MPSSNYGNREGGWWGSSGGEDYVHLTFSILDVGEVGTKFQFSLIIGV